MPTHYRPHHLAPFLFNANTGDMISFTSLPRCHLELNLACLILKIHSQKLPRDSTYSLQEGLISRWLKGREWSPPSKSWSVLETKKKEKKRYKKNHIHPCTGRTQRRIIWKPWGNPTRWPLLPRNTPLHSPGNTTTPLWALREITKLSS